MSDCGQEKMRGIGGSLGELAVSIVGRFGSNRINLSNCQVCKCLEICSKQFRDSV